MRKVVVFGLLVGILALGLGVAYAANQAGPAKKPHTMMATGTVKSFEAGKSLVLTTKDGKELTFDLSGAKMKQTPKVGDTVTVHYLMKEGKNVATTVAVAGAAKK
jgi:hypothetical protein